MITIHQEKETDFTKNGYGTLDDYIINPEISWEMNGEFMLNFDYPVFAPYSKYLTDENIVRAPVPYMDDQLFRIYRPIPRLGYIQVTAKHIFYDLNDNFVEDTNVVGKNGLGALNQILNATQYPHRFNAFSDIDTVGNARIVRYNPVEALLDDSKDNTFINRWGGEVYRDNFNIHMRKRLGSNRGVRIEHKKDLTGFESEMDFSTVITRIMPKGFDGLLLPEKYVDSPLLDPDRPKIRVVEYSEVKAAVGEYANDEDAIPLEAAYAELRRLASREYSINHVDEPETVIHVDFVTLENTKEYEDFKELQTIHQGDTVRVSVPEQDIEINSRLVAFKSNPLLENHYTSTTLGNHVLEYTTSRTEIDVIRKEIKNTNELITITRQAANGKNSNFWGTADPNALELNAQIDDTYFQEDGDYFAIWEYVEVNGERYWRKGPNTDFGKEIANQLKEAIADVELAQQTADEAVDEINTAVSNAGFTSLSDSLTGIQSIANSAQNNSVTAVANAQTALNLASSVQSDVASIDLRVDEIEGTLSLKADSQSLDTLTGRVSLAETNIGINAQGLALKANQDTVDTLAGTVSSLGTEFDIVAGQVNSRVWNTDIDTAIDEIEVGGRNHLRNTEVGNSEPISMFGHPMAGPSFSFSTGTEYYTLESRVSSGEVYYRALAQGTVPSELSGTWTFSGEVLIPEGTSGAPATRTQIAITSPYGWVNSYGNGERPINATKGIWTKFIHTFEMPKGTQSLHLGIKFANNTQEVGDKIHFKNFKLEKGNKGTDWTPAPEDTTTLISHVETVLTQKYDTITANVASIDGRVATNILTLDGTITRVGDAEGRLTTVETNVGGLQTTVAGKANQSQVTQLSGLLSSTVEDVEDNKTQISQNATNINLRVAKGDVVTQLNLDAGRVLVSSSKILLNADTVTISGTAWMSGAVIANSSIGTAQIADLAVTSAKIASLDVAKISGNRTEFVTSYWNANDSDVRITGVGLQTVSTGGDYARVTAGELRSYNYANDASAIMGKGRSQYYIDGTSRVIMGRTLHGNSWANEATIQVAHSRRFAIGRYNAITSDSQVSFWAYMGLEYGIQGNEGSGYVAFYKQAEFENITTFTSEVRIRSGTNSSQIKQEGGALRHYANTSYSWNLGEYRVLTIERSGTNNYTSMYAHLNMQGYTITNAANISDERMKDVHGLRDENDLDKLMNIKYVDFTWNDSNLGGRDFGFVAQQVKNIVPEMMMDVAGGYLGFNQQTYIHLIGHAVQQLALREENTNAVASQALQLGETNEEKIKRLEKRIEELESAA